MGLEALLDHKCDIYHIVEEESSPGFSLPSSPAFTYPETPDETDVNCHFGVRTNDNINIIQNEPQNEMTAKIKLTLPIGTDIRLNDRIVDKGSGLDYTADQPRPIRGHHIFVYAQRRTEQRAL
jgi:hypothetical protein